ncbi:MAG TPA: tyrosine-type recombinase/integrase [Roseiarcus sp.]
MRVGLKGVNSRTKRLANGRVVTYYWAWKGGPPLPGKPGSPEFMAAYYAAIARKLEPPSGVLLSLLMKFQASGEFEHKISHRTRRDYVKQIKRIERAFGDFPIKALDDRGARAVFLEWRDELAKTSLRQADYAYGTLARILSWAVKRGLIDTNPCAEGGKLYSGSRVDKVWPDDKVARFLAVAPQVLRLPMFLAINTGQRQGDLRRLPWSAYDGKVIKIRQKKTGAYVAVPVSDELKTELDAAPRVSPLMLVNTDGKPWSESGFQSAWGKATARAGIEDLTFHDLRGTAVVTLARAGCNEVEIYTITGHKPSDVQAVLTAHYLPRDEAVAKNAIAKLNAYRKRSGDQTQDENLPTALPTALKTVGSKGEKA